MATNSLPALPERKVAGQKRTYVKCRAWGHAWDDVIGADWDLSQETVRMIRSGFAEALRCMRCTGRRIFMRTWDGKVYSRSYQLPEDYGDVTSLSKADAAKWLQEHPSPRMRRGQVPQIVYLIQDEKESADV